MAIAYVNGAMIDIGGTTAVTLTVTYSPTAGNEIVLDVSFEQAVTAVSCADNNGNALLLNGTAGSGANTDLTFQFYGTAIAGATSYKVSWTTGATCAICITEYSGVLRIGATNQTNSGNSAAPSITVVTTGPNSFIAAAMTASAGRSITFTTGHMRQQEIGLSAVDNTAASSGTSVTCAGTVFSAPWCAVAIELLSVAPPPNLGDLFQFGWGMG